MLYSKVQLRQNKSQFFPVQPAQIKFIDNIDISFCFDLTIFQHTLFVRRKYPNPFVCSILYYDTHNCCTYFEFACYRGHLRCMKAKRVEKKREKNGVMLLIHNMSKQADNVHAFHTFFLFLFEVQLKEIKKIEKNQKHTMKNCYGFACVILH